MYASARVFFTKDLPDDLLKLIASSKAVPYIEELKVIYYDFRVTESRLFTFERPDGMFQLCSPLPTADAATTISELAEKLTSVCAICGYFPYVCCTKNENAASFKIAKEVEKRLCDLKCDPPLRRDSQCRLLVLDRCFDPISPLLTEFTLQAMAADLLGLDHEKITYPLEENTPARVHVQH